MLKHRIISRVLSTYESPSARQEYKRAFDIFFRNEFTSALTDHPQAEEIQKLFHEWFIFDFELLNGKTPLVQFVGDHLASMSKEERDEGQALIQSVYDVFEVLTVMPGTGMTVRGLKDDTVHEVQERLGSQKMPTGAWLIGRLGSMSDHDEFVGSMLFELPMKFDRSMRPSLQEFFQEVNPRTVCEFLLDARQDETQKPSLHKVESMSYPEAKERLQKLFKAHDIEKFFSLEQLEKCLKSKQSVLNDLSTIMGLVVGLSKEEPSQELVETLVSFMNRVPRKELGGESPDKWASASTSGPNIVMNSIDLGGHVEHAAAAHQHLCSGRHQQAIEAYRRTFQALLDTKTTIRDVYRLYANLATALFAYGDQCGGLRALETAHALNPHYDFAKDQLERYHTNELDGQIFYGRLQGMLQEGFGAYRLRYGTKRAYEREPWYEHEKFLKRFHLNFYHPPDDPTKCSFFKTDGTKIQRNEPCPCGSGVKYKKCHGK